MGQRRYGPGHRWHTGLALALVICLGLGFFVMRSVAETNKTATSRQSSVSLSPDSSSASRPSTATTELAPQSSTTPTSVATADVKTTRPAKVNPLEMPNGFYVAGSERAARAANERRGSDSEGAALLDRLAKHNVTFTIATDDVMTNYVQSELNKADQRQQMPVLILYYIPVRDCGNYSAGGAPSAASYRSWIDRVSGTIGARKVAIIYEPDAVSTMHCITSAQRSERIGLLRYGLQTLAERNPGAVSYIEAGSAS